MNNHRPDTAENRIYRGRTIEELLPKIREELGADAVVVAQREGLAGGVAGFFQQKFVEIEAQPGAEPAPPPLPAVASFDAYVTEGDDEREEPMAAAIAEALPSVTDLAFAEHLNAAAIDADATQLAAVTAEVQSPAPTPAPTPAPAPARGGQYVTRLVDAGLPEAIAADVVGETLSHSAPFGPPRQLKRLVRAALARRIPVEPSFRGRRRVVAIVGAPGSGKTLVADRLATAYEQGSDLPVRRIALGSARGDARQAADQVFAPDAEGFAVVDTPGISRTNDEAIAALARHLRTLRPDEVHLALPATLSRAAATELLDALAPLKATRLVLTHADATDHVAPVVGLAIERGVAFSFVSFGDALPVGLVPADPDDLAGRVLG